MPRALLDSCARTAANMRLSGACTVDRLHPNTSARIVISQAPTNMANIIVTLRIMPESPDSNLKAIEQNVSKLVKEFGGEVGKVEEKPVAYGLKALNIIFIMDESIGSTEELEKKAAEVPHVSSVEVTDVRRAVG